MDLSILFSGVLTLLLGVIIVRLRRSLKLFRVRKNYTAALNAPSVSVCIPARNEMHAMAECLERVLASDYKKLEVIVYDDSSADNTSILVRSFAYAGVRFVAGSDLPKGWLGKNHALDVLAREASGTYVIFMDVDTRIAPTTISQIVGYTMTEDVEMVSVIPRRNDAYRASVLFGHLRYFWELVLSTTARPATSSAFWIMRRQTLLDTFEGFTSCKSVVAPEAVFARQFGTSAYHCLVSNAGLGVAYEKKWLSQVETSQRLLYPRIGGSWWSGLFVSMGLLLLNAPFFAMLSGLVFGWTTIQVMALWLMLAHGAVYAVYVSYVWKDGWWLGGLLWPLIIFQELVLFVRSMYGYARRRVTWKGRLVTSTVSRD